MTDHTDMPEKAGDPDVVASLIFVRVASKFFPEKERRAEFWNWAKDNGYNDKMMSDDIERLVGKYQEYLGSLQHPLARVADEYGLDTHQRPEFFDFAYNRYGGTGLREECSTEEAEAAMRAWIDEQAINNDPSLIYAPPQVEETNDPGIYFLNQLKLRAYEVDYVRRLREAGDRPHPKHPEADLRMLQQVMAAGAITAFSDFLPHLIPAIEHIYAMSRVGIDKIPNLEELAADLVRQREMIDNARTQQNDEEGSGGTGSTDEGAATGGGPGGDGGDGNR